MPDSGAGWQPGATLDGRWLVGERLGSGSFGEVFAGTDLLAGAAVALKRLGAFADRADAARESAALRLLRIPGVVRLLDEFVLDGHTCLVLERASGTPFPGDLDGRASSDLVQLAARLLAIVGRIHAAGLLHLDLKPANVLVDTELRPQVLDLGIAAGRAFSPWDAAERSGRGSRLFAAPEQLLGHPVDARTDLFAVGVLLFVAATGGVHPFPGRVAAGEFDFDAPAPPLLSVAPHAPPALAMLCASLLQADPDKRPASAASALEFLDIEATRSLPARLFAGPDAVTAAELKSLFRGPDRLLHLAEDAAAELHRRTDGQSDRVRAELAAWIEMGLAAWDGQRIAMSRRDLALLVGEHQAEATAGLPPDELVAFHTARAASLQPGSEGRFLSLVLAGATDEAPREALASARRCLDAGQLEAAMVALFEGISVLEDEPDADPTLARDLFRTWAAAALGSQSERQLALLRQRIQAHPTAAELSDLVALLDAALAALGTDGPRALERLHALGRHPDPHLEASRIVFLALAARHVSEAEEAEVLRRAIQATQATATPLIQRVVMELEGRRHYRLGHYADAARSHEQAGVLAPGPGPSLVSTLNAASAWLEAGELDRARSLAASAMESAAALRAHVLEAHATWLERTARYRAGENQVPDEELLRALDQLGHPGFEAQIRFHEAVLAWRAGRHPLARESSLAAERIWRARGQTVPADLARLVALEAGKTLTSAELAAIADRTTDVADASLHAQLGGLLARAGVSPRLSWAAALAKLQGPDHQRWDVLSLAELRAAQPAT